MGDVLAGNNAVWEFESDALVIRYNRSVRGSRLLQALGERRVPHTALSGVELTEGRRGTAVLRAVPRAGADPLIEAAGGQLKETADPYRLVLPEQSRALAESCRDQLAAAVAVDGGPSDEPPGRFLVAAPDVPRAFKAYDGKAFFDGRTVGFRWFWTGASSAKWKAGDQSFPVDELTGVDWRSPERLHGHLRLLRRDSDQPGGPPAPPGEPDQDPAAVVFGLGYGPVHESLPFAAAVLAAIRAVRVKP
ncbi:DUF4429 domain-containing protein [Streptomyces sp. CA-111067]|uniref:DUF4429 domain-containing protein n=1 Tax=Streptomyces sp. CA-111067 TaxID=3240046 RepID=UPI003D988FF3